MNNDCAVLVLSCDRYSDAWQPFFDLFSRYWKNCQYPVYLGNNGKEFSHANVKVLHAGRAVDWTTDTRKIVEQISEPYMIVLLEDYFLLGDVDESYLAKCLAVTKEYEAAFTRIASFRSDHFPMYAFDAIPGKDFMGVTRNKAPFRINLQAGIWNRQDFLSLLKNGESPWEFEVNGSVRSQSNSKPFLGITESSHKDVVAGPIPYLCTAITKGTWMREAVTLCKNERVAIDLSKRPTETRLAYTWRKIYHGLSYPNRKYVDFLASKLKKH